MTEIKTIILDFGKVLAGPTTGNWFITPKFKEYDDYCVLVDFGDCIDEDIYVPDTYNGKPVTEIHCLSMVDNYNIKSVTIPDTVRMSVLRQDHFAFDAYTVLDTVMMGNKKLYDIKVEKDAIYEKEDFSDVISRNEIHKDRQSRNRRTYIDYSVGRSEKNASRNERRYRRARKRFKDRENHGGSRGIGAKDLGSELLG